METNEKSLKIGKKEKQNAEKIWIIKFKKVL